MTITDQPPSQKLVTIDKERLRQKYLEERNKRLRPDGNDQYIQVKGQLAHYLDDPYTPVTPREPKTDHVTFAFIGGGFAGLATAARLSEAGIKDVRIIEKGGDFGGTWYWNRYPGAQCDTASMVYMPLLEETGHMPSEKYAHAPEILAHCQRIGKQFGLYANALFHTQVESLDWDEAKSRWLIRTNRGDAFTAQFVGMGTGPLHVPKLPGITGIEQFKGHSFHTSRWDYDYTGGDRRGAPMEKLADKRVGIIGTGATSVQCVPHLARACKELYVFQRTPSSVDVRANAPIDPNWFAGIATPGWQQRWLENFTANQAGGNAKEDLVQDGWTDLARRIREKIVLLPREQRTPPNMLAAFEDSDFEKMEEIRSRVDTIVGDRETAAKLKAWYRQLCKRPCFHDEYLQAFNQPGTHLVDTDGKGVERITENGVVVAGREYQARLHHLCLGVRGRHGISPAVRLRSDRARRRQAVGPLGRGHAHQARHPRARFPERVLRAADAGRQPHLQRAAQSDRSRKNHCLDGWACPVKRLQGDRSYQRGRGSLDRAAADRRGTDDRLARLHARLLQQ